MTKNKVIHARIDDNTHELLFEKCNELGCSFTDYIESVIRASLEDQVPSDVKSESTIMRVDV
jgi:antitoxin component of RelBE/YafQ-DinJ toxin-antitoxin module